MDQHIQSYKKKLIEILGDKKLNKQIEKLYNELLIAWKNKKSVFICGNGGSAGNAIHLANDFLYGAGIKNKYGLKIEALTANPSVITCLANDLGYESIFAEQLKVKANENDLLIVLSGSGNSKNVTEALEEGNRIKMVTFAILGYDGGKCKSLAKNSIHFEINDMQISEDLQLIVMHMIMQKLSSVSIR